MNKEIKKNNIEEENKISDNHEEKVEKLEFNDEAQTSFDKEITEEIKEKEEEIKEEENKEEENKQDKNIDNENTKEKKIENKINQQKENYIKNEKNLKKLIVLVVCIILIMFFSVIFSILNMNNNKILKNISILGIDVGDNTIEEATNRINEAINVKFNDENESIVLHRDDLEISINANTLNAKFNIEKAIAEAYNIGRGGNIITNNYSILGSMISKKEIKTELGLDQELLKTLFLDVNSKMKDAVKEYSYYIEKNDLYIVQGTPGYIVDKEELTNRIYNQLENIHTHYGEISIPVKYVEPKKIDILQIREEIYKEPKDACVLKDEKITVFPEVNGIDLGITVEEAYKLLEESKEQYKIPLRITIPKVKLSDLGEEAFPDELSKYSTLYDATNYNRAHNIELATRKINGTVIMPGEIFSFNTITGRRTKEAGYKEGTAYINGKVVPDVGGGVCQVSSTLYNVALLANLKITERSNHLFLTGYVPQSRDATVYYGSLDFCFKNTRSYPIKIVATSGNGVCKISLKGIKEEVEYDVSISSRITSYINKKTVYKDDPKLEEGKEIVEKVGCNGCRSEAYRILKFNGKIISRELLSKDTYSPIEKEVRRGTKKVGKKEDKIEDKTENKIDNKMENKIESE